MLKSLIFLDFDGVLTCDETRANFPVRHLDPSRVATLNRLVEDTEAQIVLSTSWRHPWGLSEEILNVLERDGLPSARARVIGQTPHMGTRQEEIGAWLMIHQHPAAICILDDEPIGGYLGRYWVMTDPRIGLTKEKAEEAAALLKEKGE